MSTDNHPGAVEPAIPASPPDDGAKAVPPAAAAQHSTRSRGGVFALVVLLALAGVAWLAWDTRNSVTQARAELAQRLGEQDTLVKQTQALAAQAVRDVKDALAKLSVQENKIAESQSQQIALEALYAELSRSRDEFSLAEVEEALDVASQQLQLAGNVRAALIALQSVDTRLARYDKPRWTQLRRAVARDMERLKAVPFVDVVGISARLDNLIAAVAALPLAAAPVQIDEGGRGSAAAEEPGALRRLWQDMWNSLRDLIRIRDLGTPELVLLPPSQEFFLRENLKLRLLNARFAVLARDEESYKADLKAARAILAMHFDQKARVVVNAHATLRQLAESQISIAPPDITDSLNAVKAARTAAEKGAR